MVNSFGAVQMVRRGGTERLSLLLLIYLIVCLFVCLLKYSRRLVLEGEIWEFVAQSNRVDGGESLIEITFQLATKWEGYQGLSSLTNVSVISLC